MKKRNIILLVVIILLILIFIYFKVVSMQNEKKAILKYNEEFEEYLDKEIYGTNVITVINKAMDYNEKNKIVKDEKGFFIDDGKDSIIVELNFINSKDKILVYRMEQIVNLGIEKFLSSDFNLVDFKCTQKEYHENGKISKITFTQLEK